MIIKLLHIFPHNFSKAIKIHVVALAKSAPWSMATKPCQYNVEKLSTNPDDEAERDKGREGQEHNDTVGCEHWALLLSTAVVVDLLLVLERRHSTRQRIKMTS